MGSFLEMNDTLQITTDQGFPANVLDVKKHRKSPVSLNDVKDKIFEFHDKPNARHYHTPPTRCFLVHNINGKWLYWGKIIIIEQTVRSDNENKLTTSGKFRIIDIYEPGYQEEITKRESPKGLSYF